MQKKSREKPMISAAIRAAGVSQRLLSQATARRLPASCQQEKRLSGAFPQRLRPDRVARKPAQPTRLQGQLHRIMQPTEVPEKSPALTNAERWASVTQAIKPRVMAACAKGTFRASEMSMRKKYFRTARWIFTAARLHFRSMRR